MYIERIDIGAFGGLSQRSFAFSEGVNLIKADNECGKSTLSAALRFALYGFGGRSASILGNPKKLYMPWSGAAASVAVTLAGERRLRIERICGGTKEQAICTDLSTGKQLYAGLCFGEEIFGIGAETFEKTLFFSTLTPPEAKDEGLASALQNLVFSADEQIGTEKAKETLSKHKNALKGRITGTGEIPKLEEEERRLEEKLASERAAMHEIEEAECSALFAEKSLAEKTEDVRRLKNELQNLEAYRAAMLLEEYRGLKQRAQETAEALKSAPYADKSGEYIEKCRAARDRRRFCLSRLEEARKQYTAAKQKGAPAEPDSDGIFAAVKARQRYRGAAVGLSFPGALLLALAAVLAVFVSPKTVALAVAAAGAAVCAAALICLALAAGAVKKAGFGSAAELKSAAGALPALRAEREAALAVIESAEIRFKQAEAEYETANREYTALVPTGNDEAVDAMYAGFTAASGLRAECDAAERAVKGFETANDLASLETLSKGAVKPERAREQIETEYRFASRAEEGLKEKLAGLKSRIETLHGLHCDPAETESALSYTRAEKRDRLYTYAALQTALDELQAASDGMRASISPRIAAIAGENFAVATGGKYPVLELDARLYLSFESGAGMKSAEYLSAGTREAAYLCLRLATAKLLYGERQVPFLLDDAFAHTDDGRLEGLLKLICGKGCQVIILSCTDREERAMRSLGCAYTKVSL